MWLRRFKSWYVHAMVGSIMVVGALTYYASFCSMCELLAFKMNVQSCLILELILYEFWLGHNIVEKAKNICCVKGEVGHGIITRWFKKFRSGHKNLDGRSNKFRSASNSRFWGRAPSYRDKSNEFGISLSSMYRHRHDLGKSIRSCQIVPHILLKYCKTFDWL